MATRSKRFAQLEEQQARLASNLPKREPPVEDLKVRAAEAAVNGTLHWNNLQLQVPLPAVPIPPNTFHLKLGNNELLEIPKEVLRLQQLRILEINANLMDQVPVQISVLETLQALYLNNNRLGVLPPEIAKLTNLHTLDLHGNRLHEVPLELRALTLLTSFSVSDNMLRIPFQYLERVSIPDMLGALQVLLKAESRKELNMNQLDMNRLQSTPMEQAHRLCTVLTSLYLPNVRVDTVTDLIKDFLPLTLLCFNGCNIHSVAPAIGELTVNLSLIDLRRNLLTALPPGFGTLSSLRTLLLDDNKIQVFPRSVFACRSLTHLSMRRNALEEIPPEVAQLADMKVLCCGYNKLVDLPVELAQLDSLEVLELVNNSIDTMPLYLLQGLEAQDMAMPPLDAPLESVSDGDCLCRTLLAQEAEFLAAAAQRCEATQYDMCMSVCVHACIDTCVCVCVCVCVCLHACTHAMTFVRACVCVCVCVCT